MPYAVTSMNNEMEKNAEANGYTLYSCYDTKEEIDHVIHQLHGNQIRAFKARHRCTEHANSVGFNSDLWFLYVKDEDLKAYGRWVKAGSPVPEPPKKRTRGGERRKQAQEIIRLKDEEGKSWEEIAKIMNRTFYTVQKYYYLEKQGNLTDEQVVKKKPPKRPLWEGY